MKRSSKRENNTPSFRLREAALRVLVRAEQSGSFANLVLPAYLKNLPLKGRSLATAITYGTAQRRNTCRRKRLRC